MTCSLRVLMLSAAVQAVAGSGLLLAGDRVRPDEVLKWNEILVDAIRKDNTPPPLASRNMALAHGVIYDSVNAVTRTHAPYQVNVVPPPAAFTSPDAAAAAAGHRVLSQLYPRQKDVFDEALHASLAKIGDASGKTEGVRLGRFVADRFLDWRSPDESIRRVDHSPSSEPGVWRPTPPQLQKALVPEWGRLMRFAVNSSDKQFAPPAPPRLSSREYARYFNETKTMGAIDSTTRTEDETEIAYFWADGAHTCTPPGHWNEIARTVALDRGNTLAENARLFALLNIAMADAAILCWDCKFRYNLWRPVTAIRNADYDGNVDTVVDPDWTPLLETPPFPAYTSGHSSFSGAAARILADFFGTDNVRFTVTSDALPTVERSFTSFSQAAEEAGRSRIYAGIHWDCDNVEGLAMGRSLGAYVYRRILLSRT